MRKPTIKSLKSNLDRLIQIKGLEENKDCLVCGHQAQVMHHFFTKGSSQNLRWNMRNLVPLCHSCHCKHHNGQDPRINKIIVEKKGDAWFKEMEKLQPVPFKTNMKILKEKLNQTNIKA